MRPGSKLASLTIFSAIDHYAIHAATPIRVVLLQLRSLVFHSGILTSFLPCLRLERLLDRLAHD